MFGISARSEQLCKTEGIGEGFLEDLHDGATRLLLGGPGAVSSRATSGIVVWGTYL